MHFEGFLHDGGRDRVLAVNIGDRAGESFVVEAEEILEGSPASPDDDQVDIVPPVERFDPR